MPTGCWAKMLHLSGQYSISSPCFRAVQIFMQANESKPNQSNTVHSNHKPVVAIQTNSAIPFPTIPFHCIQLQIPLGDAIYTDGKENARHLGNQWKLELAMVAAMWLQFH